MFDLPKVFGVEVSLFDEFFLGKSSRLAATPQWFTKKSAIPRYLGASKW